MLNQEQLQVLLSKPLGRMRQFCALLNWRGLQLECMVVSSDLDESGNESPSGVIAYYMTPDWKFNLQINESPSGQSVTHQATIKAERYGVSDIGWHRFTLFNDDFELQREAERLSSILDRQLFKNPKWVRAFKRENADLVVPTRKKHRGCLTESR